MALWNDKDTTPAAAPTPARAPTERPPAEAAGAEARRAPARDPARESLIAAELTIEGRIQGTGNIRLAGRFKGDVQVDGDVSIESGAHVEGGIQAHGVVVGGELTGNIDKARHVDVQRTGVVVGDIKADSISVAAGSRMRGHVEFGWTDGAPARPVPRSTPTSS